MKNYILNVHNVNYLPNSLHCSTFIRRELRKVLSKYSWAALPSSSFWKPIKAKWRNFPSLVYLSWTSVITPFWLNVSLSLSSVIYETKRNNYKHRVWSGKIKLYLRLLVNFLWLNGTFSIFFLKLYLNFKNISGLIILQTHLLHRRLWFIAMCS